MRVHTMTAAVVLSMAAGAMAQVTVYSNNPGGDNFTNPGTLNTGTPVTSTPGWYYNNVRNDGVVGINGTYARSGNGSVYMQTVNGPGGNSSKADIEYYQAASPDANGNYNPAGIMGALGGLSALSYEWYRDGVSTNDPGQHPSLRLRIYDAANNSVFYLVYERAYNGGGAAPTNTWTPENVFGMNANLWATGAAFNGYGTTLAQWMANPALFVVGISSGVGSGWGPFVGAVDNITFGFGGNSTTFNFEVVPAPATAGLLGLAGLAATRRRRAC